jgi:hypothetical protein
MSTPVQEVTKKLPEKKRSNSAEMGRRAVIATLKQFATKWKLDILTTLEE